MSELEQINKRLEEIKPKAVKWKHIVGIVASSIMVVIGVTTLIVGLSTNNIDILSWFSAPFGILGLLYLTLEIYLFSKSLKYIKEEEELLQKKKELENGESNDKELLAMKLLSEGKISKEEFDKLVK